METCHGKGKYHIANYGEVIVVQWHNVLKKRGGAQKRGEKLEQEN